MSCRNCGANNRLGSTECARCRFPLDAVHTPTLQRTVRKPAMRIAVVVVLMGLVSAVVWLTIAPQSSSQVVVDVPAPVVETQSGGFMAPAPPEPEPAPAVESPSVAEAAPKSAAPTAGMGRAHGSIQNVIRAQLGAVRKCYEAGLTRNPKLGGTVKVTFVIGADGRVTSAAKDASDLPDSAVAQCIVARILVLKFPPSADGPVTVTYPFKFAAD